MKPVFSFQWHITDNCDQRCKHCYIFSGNEDKKLHSMSWSDIESTLDNCLEFCQFYGRRPYFYLTGGDPILHPHFWDLLERLHEKGIPFSILGNPFHLSDGVCKRLKDLGCQSYQLSLDGLEKTHDWFRKPGSFAITLEKIAQIKKAGMKSVIMSTVSEVNIDEILPLIDVVAENNVDVFAFARFVPGDGQQNGLDPLRYRKLLEESDHKFKEYQKNGCKTRFNRKDHLWTLYQYETGEFLIPDDAQKDMIYGGCNCGNCHLTILPDGDVYACRRVSQSRVGNIRENRLKDLWVDEMENYRDFEAFEKCRDCELKAWCRGCPAVAKGTHGSFYSRDPQCWKEINASEKTRT